MVSFFKYRQYLIIIPVILTVFTCSVHQLRIYAFGAPTTCLRVWCTPEALTNQGETHRYIDHVVCFNTRDSHHRLNEHTILNVFHAPRHDSLVPLNWYKQVKLRILAEEDI